MASNTKVTASPSEKAAESVGGDQLLPGIRLPSDPMQSWFSQNGCVVRSEGQFLVVVAGTVIGGWSEGETGSRNSLLVQLAMDPRVHLGKLSKSFGLSSETVRAIRRKYESFGLLAVMTPTVQDRHPLAPETVRRMESLFTQGKKGEEVVVALRGKACRASVSKYRRLWQEKRDEQLRQSLVERTPEQVPLPLPVESAPVLPPGDCPPQPVTPPASAVAGPIETLAVGPKTEAPELGAIRIQRDESDHRVSAIVLREEAIETAEPEQQPPRKEASIGERMPRSGRGVANAGSWLLVAMVAKLGLYQDAQGLLPATKRSVRVALSALIGALAIGGGCVEGVRRLATRTAAILILSSAMPSATWVRRALGAVSGASEPFHTQFAARLINLANEETGIDFPVVFYVDNHTREYTGKQELAWHFKMQLDHAVPGVTDYWIHDAHGRPIAPITAFQQGSLTQFLPACARVIREALGKSRSVVVVIDRAGAFPKAMASLKNLLEGPVGFLTYERAPYRRHGRGYFEKHGEAIELENPRGEKYRVLVLDGGAHLGKGSGRVRRLQLLLPDDSQLNVLTSCKTSAAWLIRTLFARWLQENAFKYGGIRWGFDHLDGRQVVPYLPGTLIPNPNRRRLKRALSTAIIREAGVRRERAKLKAGDPHRDHLKREAKDARKTIALVKRALSTRTTPEKLPIEQTELSGKLVHQPREYKLLIDTVRVACMYAEDQLAQMLACHLTLPREAKCVLKNIFKATGNIHVSDTAITVTVDPCANRSELRALQCLFGEIDRLKLTLPGDARHRALRFALQPALLPQKL